MRLFTRTAWALVAGSVVLSALGTAAVLAGDDDDDGEEDAAAQAAAKKVATDALVKAVARGKEIWNDKTNVKKTCATCHEAADKPQLNLATRDWSYPAYSRRKRAVVTLQQKLQEMIQFQCRGTVLDDKGPDIAALAAYVASLKKK
ncbi:MAG: hypothetical protein K8T90_11165 [Planctomycetes bacterium]|nr:hypothetical protein [Planctomycetota bacterium]